MSDTRNCPMLARAEKRAQRYERVARRLYGLRDYRGDDFQTERGLAYREANEILASDPCNHRHPDGRDARVSGGVEVSWQCAICGECDL